MSASGAKRSFGRALSAECNKQKPHVKDRHPHDLDAAIGKLGHLGEPILNIGHGIMRHAKANRPSADRKAARSNVSFLRQRRVIFRCIGCNRSLDDLFSSGKNHDESNREKQHGNADGAGQEDAGVPS
jgi:hypothetical protein